MTACKLIIVLIDVERGERRRKPTVVGERRREHWEGKHLHVSSLVSKTKRESSVKYSSVIY